MLVGSWGGMVSHGNSSRLEFCGKMLIGAFDIFGGFRFQAVNMIIMIGRRP